MFVFIIQPTPAPSKPTPVPAAISTPPPAAKEPESIKPSQVAAAAAPVKKPSKKFVATATSKFRHMLATLLPRKTHMFDIKNVSISTFMECDGFHANKKWAAVPLGGPGGMIAIVDVSEIYRCDLLSGSNVGTIILCFVTDGDCSYFYHIFEYIYNFYFIYYFT